MQSLNYPMKTKKIEVIPVTGIPIVQQDDDITQLLAVAMNDAALSLVRGDVLIVSHTIVSIAEGRMYEESGIVPSQKAREIAAIGFSSETRVEIALQEASDIIREEPVLITKTKQGIITDFSGVDESNAPEGTLIVLPEDSDQSALRIHKSISEAAGFSVPVIITDTQGRPWRKGAVNLAIGIAGMSPFVKNEGRKDIFGKTLRSSLVCVADEIAASAELVMGQADEKVPVAIIRGFSLECTSGSAQDILREGSENIFK